MNEQTRGNGQAGGQAAGPGGAEQRPAGAVQVMPLFATPIVLYEFPKKDEINAALREVILEREKSHPSTQHSNLGGWQSSWDMLEWGGEYAQRVVSTACSIANKVTATREGKPVNIEWKVNCWANVNRSGHGNEFHTHPGSFWSVSYYIDDGGIAENPALGGEFEIQDPRGVGPAMYAPRLAFNYDGGLSVGASEIIRPAAGLMVMFPSWLSHAVRPYSGERERIGMAFNLSL
jgi:uncharacterized protein (TIGR02466 family)